MAGFKSKFIFGVLIFWGACSGCVTVYTARGAYHKVRPNESLETIAKRYRSTLQELAEYNNIDDTSEVKVGRSIYIPGVKVSGGFFPLLPDKKEGKRSLARPKVRQKRGEEPTPSAEEPSAEEVASQEKRIYTDHGRFSWPIVGELSSLFGIRRGRKHDGIDIRSPKGTPVHASAPGEVVFSSRMKGYGNLVLIKHEDRFFTVYAHNSANLVKKGKKVKKGDVIAKVGRTGKATGPHLHFEVRDGRRARNPLFFLPKNQYALRAKTDKHKDTGGDE